ncbi:hypothetical protein IHE45_14G110000 [Dioscorea alata]|uniref:Uncharacterized protein n=1 Tax=Dioscorea alata TaxID=55571 RepID=A0ACB7UUF5_DIOAL|nr:hypothetical protein IHE45_14G110000 [Dioscorea alata]
MQLSCIKFLLLILLMLPFIFNLSKASTEDGKLKNMLGRRVGIHPTPPYTPPAPIPKLSQRGGP